ncbi:glycosyl transferase [Bacteroidia bacterium]|nr:glycosyl transferase [Bacteroidia bacterium]
MKISLITTCYNREHTLRDAIESVLNQDYPNIEYIIVDGASTDNSLTIIQKYQNQIAKIISEPDSGMYEAINKGLRLATGDVVGLLHSDDLLFAPNTISHIARHIEQSGCDLVYGNGLYVDAQNIHKIVRNWISNNYSKSKIRRGWLPLHPTVYIKRACLEQIGLYDETFQIAADTDFLIRCLYKSNLKVSYLNEYIVRMRMGGLSTSITNHLEKWREDLLLYRSHGFNPYLALAGKIFSKISQYYKR